MNAPWAVKPSRDVGDLRAFFIGLCENRADLYADGVLTLHEAVDELQAIAELTGLVAAVGQDEVQRIISGDISPVPESDDVSEAYELEIRRRAAELVRDWELSDDRDRWKHTGEPKPAPRSERPARRQSHAPPAATVDAFRYVLGLDDPAYLDRWLADHPSDALALFKIWKSRPCR